MGDMLLSVVLLMVAVVLAVGIRQHNRESPHDKAPMWWALIPLAAAAAFLALGCVYGQDAGEVIVKINLGGSLAGYTEEAGFHVKAPWQSTVKYDTRNNLINLYRDADYTYDGGAAEGACVTVNDKGGASADIDLQVVYSLNGASALKLYEDYGTQEKFTSDVILNNVRATAREVAGQYDTITLLTNRGEFTKGIRDALAAKWSELGLNIEQTSVQDVRYDDAIMGSYDEAAKAKVERETAQINAERKLIDAQGEAAANRELTSSLTNEVIQKQYVDALEKIGKNGNLVVVPMGSTPMVNVPGNVE